MMHRHWERHTACVPKGFLRLTILKLLNEKPLSGSEIMDIIESETKGLWRPSPGSVYPLLAWLMDKGFIKESQKSDDGMKRYTITEEGKAFLKNAKDVIMDLGSLKFMIPTLITPLGITPREEDFQLKAYLTRFFSDLINFRKSFEVNPSKQKFEKVCMIIKDACERIENVLGEIDKVNS
ncbi:MAG: PadR family transcriptional regulator [Nitrososphaeria archaeon]|nr:PadR family transcriptional regulator [Nitrososphaeria archaeon]